MLGQQRVLEMKSPNGGIYRYVTNALDEKDFNDYQRQLEEAVKSNNQEEFDEIWNSLTNTNSIHRNIEQEFKHFHHEMGRLLEETSPFFKNRGYFLDRIKTFPLNQDSIDDKIKRHQERIEELQKLKENVNEENRKNEVKNQIEQLQHKLNEKLDEFGKNLHDEEMKKKLTDELTEISQVGS